MRSIGIVVARGGSKRIPGKNITPVLRKPLVCWTIEAALESGTCDRLLVSTDSPEIARVATEAGAEVPFLRNQAVDDAANASEACIVALNQAEIHWEESYSEVILFMPTCPLRTGEDIRRQYADFTENGDDFLLSCADFGPTKPWWAFKMDDVGRATYLHPKALTMRSQTLEKLYAPSGATWIAKVDALRNSKSFYGPGHRFHALPWLSALDIDEPEDIDLAEVFLQRRVRR